MATRRFGKETLGFLAFIHVAFFLSHLHGDQVEMKNGDRYTGQVLSLNTNTLVLRNANLGTITLPRDQVVLLSLGTNALPSISLAPPALPQAVTPPANPAFDAAVKQLSSNSNLIRQVQSKFLTGENSDAAGKYNELLNGLMSGNLNIGDIRNQAISVSKQLREAKKELGEDTGWALDSYLAILDKFVRESAPTAATTATPPKQPTAKAAPKQKAEADE